MVQVIVDLIPENDKKVKQHMLDKNLTNKSDAVNDLLSKDKKKK